MTYNEAYDKIIQAYFKDEIHPWDADFCFCGNLCDKTSEWYLKASPISQVIIKNYAGHEWYKMERALLETMYSLGVFASTKVESAEYEDALFAGMSAALEVLKQIHRERGEDVESVPVFTKRQLVL